MSNQPLVIKFLQTHSLQDLYTCHGVAHRFDNDHTKISLNYDMLAFKPGDLLAEQCRGIIIRPNEKFSYDVDQIVGDCKLLAWPMNKFYNQGESHVAAINIDDAILWEKLDGTMTMLYWDDLKNKWCVGTRGVPEADVPIHEGHLEISNKTFNDLFVDAIKNFCSEYDVHYDDWISQFNKTITYVFELTSKYNKIVVDYDYPTISLLAARDLLTGLELSIYDLQLLVQYPQQFELDNFENIKKFVDSQNPNVLEGCVVCDKNFNRIKIKNSKWVFAARAKENICSSKRNALEICLNGQIDDILPFLDESLQQKLSRLNENLKFLLDITQQQFELINKNCADDDYKSFALMINDLNSPLKDALFAIKRKKANSVFDYITQLTQKNKLTTRFLDSLLSKIDI